MRSLLYQVSPTDPVVFAEIPLLLLSVAYAGSLTDRAEAIFRERCTGVIWELDTARIFGLWSLFYLGRLAELNERCTVLFQEARERGDRYMVATPGPFVGSVARLA